MHILINMLRSISILHKYDYITMTMTVLYRTSLISILHKYDYIVRHRKLNRTLTDFNST